MSRRLRYWRACTVTLTPCLGAMVMPLMMASGT
jgi:hypothetical protein